MEIYRFPRLHAGVSVIRIVLPVTILAMLAGEANAGQLTTFEDYAVMTQEQRSSVNAKAASVVFKDAMARHDDTQVECLRQTYSSDYGPELEVKLAHARLQGWLEAWIERHDDDSRVEYAVARHFERVCPPSGLATSR